MKIQRTYPTSFRLTEEALGILTQLAAVNGISQTAMLELLIRDRSNSVIAFLATPNASMADGDASQR